MLVDLSRFIDKNQTVAVALSGGSDSMALIHYMLANANKCGFKVVALNVEHGIRGDESISDTEFVKNFCADNSIPLLTYTVYALDKAKKDNLTVEQAARVLRYECFYDAINNKKCDLVATAHHGRDNLESVLINLFRGTGLSGAGGIKANYKNKIVRPFIHVTKDEIDEYVKINRIPFVTDQSNFNTDYTRNYIRHNVLPQIKTVFPEAEKAVMRFTEIAEAESEFLKESAFSAVNFSNEKAEINLPVHRAVMSRAIILCLKYLGLSRDWEKSHVDGVLSLQHNENGSKITLPKGITAIKEYDKIVFYREKVKSESEHPFKVGKTLIDGVTVSVTQVSKPINYKDGFYVDGDKIPKDAVIRYKRDGDKFTKFGGGTKSLNDYLTDKKIPLRVRDELLVLASGNDVLAIFGVAVSNKLKIDENTSIIYKLN